MSDYAKDYPMLPKMFSALEVIANKENGETPQTLDEILGKLPYPVTKQAFQFTLRSLIKRGLVEKMPRECVAGKSRRMIRITPLGLHKINSESLSAIKAADKKTCGVDEVEKTDRLLKQIYDSLEI